MPGGYVYTARSRRGFVVYVGSTGNIRVRLQEHRRTSAWWREHDRMEVVEYATLEEARAAEDDAICRWDPPYNVRGGHDSPRPDCQGKRCVRHRAESQRGLLVHDYLRLRQSRRRSAPPVHEWDVARAAGVASLCDHTGSSAEDHAHGTGWVKERQSRSAPERVPAQLELELPDRRESAPNGWEEARVRDASDGEGASVGTTAHGNVATEQRAIEPAATARPETERPLVLNAAERCTTQRRGENTRRTRTECPEGDRGWKERSPRSASLPLTPGCIPRSDAPDPHRRRRRAFCTLAARRPPPGHGPARGTDAAARWAGRTIAV
jgi:hypothetical protein